MGGPAITPIRHQDLEKFVVYVGCYFKRQKGSHRIYWRNDQVRPVIIPCYKAVPVFIIKNILKQLHVPSEEYLRILKEL